MSGKQRRRVSEEVFQFGEFQMKRYGIEWSKITILVVVIVVIVVLVADI